MAGSDLEDIVALQIKRDEMVNKILYQKNLKYSAMAPSWSETL